MTSTISKRIQFLENQNRKFRDILKCTIEIKNKDEEGILKIREETEAMKKKITALEEEKEQLQSEFNSMLKNHGIKSNQGTELNYGDEAEDNLAYEENIQLEEDNAYLKKILFCLEQEKILLLDQLKQVQDSAENKDDLIKMSDTNVQLHEMISKLEEEKIRLTKALNNVRHNFENTEEIEISCKDKNNDVVLDNSELRLSVKDSGSEKQDLEKNTSNTSDSKMSIRKESISSLIESHDSQEILTKIKSIENTKKKLEQELSKAKVFTPLNSSTENVILELRISSLEKTKNKLMRDLQQSLEKVSEVEHNISDQNLACLVNEVDSLQSTKNLDVDNLSRDEQFESLHKISSSSSKNESVNDDINSVNPHTQDSIQTTLKKDVKADEQSQLELELDEETQEIEILESQVVIEQETESNNKSQPVTQINYVVLPNPVIPQTPKPEFENAEEKPPCTCLKNVFALLRDHMPELNGDQPVQDIKNRCDLPTVLENSKESVTPNTAASEIEGIPGDQSEKVPTTDENQNDQDIPAKHLECGETLCKTENSLGTSNRTQNNLDDATNQMYGNDYARLEQRIIELEKALTRVNKELSLILEVIREKSDVKQVSGDKNSLEMNLLDNRPKL